MPSNVVTVYDEFVGDNMYKRYPLIDDTPTSDGFNIPDSFLADLSLCISTVDRAGDESYRYSVYISRITVYPDYIFVELSDTVTGSVIAKSSEIPITLTTADSVHDRTINILPASNIPVNGVVVVGTCKDIKKYPGTHDIDPAHSTVFPGAVLLAPSCVNSIQVGGNIITNDDVILEAGDNVNLEYNALTNTITISVVPDPDQQKILTDEDLIQYLTDKFGKPLQTINGVEPDNSGNIDILPSDCFMISTDKGANSLTFYNPCGPACATYDFTSETLDRIKDLNNNLDVLKSFYDSVSNTLAQMGVRVSAVIESRNN